MISSPRAAVSVSDCIPMLSCRAVSCAHKFQEQQAYFADALKFCASNLLLLWYEILT